MLIVVVLAALCLPLALLPRLLLRGPEVLAMAVSADREDLRRRRRLLITGGTLAVTDRDAAQALVDFPGRAAAFKGVTILLWLVLVAGASAFVQWWLLLLVLGVLMVGCVRSMRTQRCTPENGARLGLHPQLPRLR